MMHVQRRSPISCWSGGALSSAIYWRAETLAPPWRDLLLVLRKKEAQGEIRGGRFVSGFSGEQFARPEALDLLRAVRRSDPSIEDSLDISNADPLNLAGIILPGPRVSTLLRGARSIPNRDRIGIGVCQRLACI